MNEYLIRNTSESLNIVWRTAGNIRYIFSAFFVTSTLPAPSGVVASAHLCCLSRVPPAVCPSLLESATTAVCTTFLRSLSTYLVRTYADASFHITIQARSTNTRFTYVQSSTLSVAVQSGTGAKTMPRSGRGKCIDIQHCTARGLPAVLVYRFVALWAMQVAFRLH